MHGNSYNYLLYGRGKGLGISWKFLGEFPCFENMNIFKKAFREKCK
jgi:hypothetical protein